MLILVLIIIKVEILIVDGKDTGVIIGTMINETNKTNYETNN